MEKRFVVTSKNTIFATEIETNGPDGETKQHIQEQITNV
jgi:hypothetical protein